MSSMRSFVAVELDANVREALGQCIARLEAEEGGELVRWVSPESIHLTLKFLGDIDAAQVPALSRALDRVVVSHARFDLALGELGCFPNPRRARVFWVGVEDSRGRLGALVESLEDALARLGFERESRPYTAHLTLGRVRRDAPRSEVASLARESVLDLTRDLALPVHAVSLMRSDLAPSGAIYARLHRAALVG
ncbi:MAG: RNA 2',3'-cyclic phosphodiesterase [Anaerolineae bacterium]